MSISLKSAATQAMDAYYQDYAPRDAFFDEDDFKRRFALEYDNLLDDMFQKLRKLYKQEEGFSNVEISASWLVREKLTVQSDDTSPYFYAQPTSCIQSFSYDKFGYALDNVRAAANCNGGVPCKMQKISPEEANYLDISPTSSLIYYWLEAENKIVLTQPVDIHASYIPAVDPENDGCILSGAIAATAIKNVLMLMFGAKNGNVVDESNDGNKNGTIQNQGNPQLNRVQTQSS
jgi:hypothetical protein